MRILTILILLSLSLIDASAQVINFEKFRIQKDTSNYWAGNLGLLLSLKKQATSVNTYSANGRLGYLSKKNAYLTLNNFKLIQNGDVNLISEGYTHWRVTYRRRKFVSFENFVQAQYDMGRGLQHRYLGGANLRFDLHSQDLYDLSLSTGLMYEHEQWTGEIERFSVSSDTSRAITSFIKSTSVLSLRYKLGSQMTFFAVGIYQARPDYFFRPRIAIDGQLVFTVKKHLAFTSELQLTYDALPAIEANKFLYRFDFGLLLKFE